MWTRLTPWPLAAQDRETAERIPSATERRPNRAERGPTLALTGDIIFDGYVENQFAHRAIEIGELAAIREVFSDVLPTLASVDFAIVNLESPVSPRYVPRDEHAVFRAPDSLLDGLADAGVDIIVVANNHAYDQGVDGLRHTLEEISARGMTAIGAGRDAERASEAMVVRRSGVRVAFAAWSEATNRQLPRVDRRQLRIALLRDGTIERSLSAARDRADLVVAIFHWIAEGESEPTGTMRAVARRAAEAGADLVVGHGPHVPGGTEYMETADGRRVLVLYSLGNLLGVMERPRAQLDADGVGVRDAPIATVRTRWRAGRLSVDAFELRAFWITRPLWNAPWAWGGRIAVSRPVRIDYELMRLAHARCGERCDSRARAYRRRIALMNEAMNLSSHSDAPLAYRWQPPERDGVRAVRQEFIELVSATRTRRALAARGLAAETDASESEEADASESEEADASESEEADASESEEADTSESEAEARPGVSQMDPLIRGWEVHVDFELGGARERAFDRDELGRIAALLRSDRTWKVVVRADMSASEPPDCASLAQRRARRVAGLIATLGPSRTRFTARAGDIGAPRSRVVVRVYR